MIDIITDAQRNLKSLKQIGTPKEDARVYIENLVYTQTKAKGSGERQVFALMGHTERMGGNYATFVEAVIPVEEIAFVGGVPVWDNKAWSSVFREIRRMYENLIIVGWACDFNGHGYHLAPDLERIHKEHFGGAHQLFFLLDSRDGEEAIYINKENALVRLPGFYVYFRTRSKEVVSFPEVIHEELSEGEGKEKRSEMVYHSGKYRKLLQEQTVEKEKSRGNLGIAVAVLLLLFVLGLGIYENRVGIANGLGLPVFGGSKDETNAQEEDSEEISVELIPAT